MHGHWGSQMELGSRSSSSSSSSDPQNGLKFGEKIYFEDVGIAAQPKSGGGSTPASGERPPASSLNKKGRSGVVQGGQPPRCQVEGCGVDLSDVKAYYSRHKVCNMHSKSPKVIVAGIEQRFCQQCSRFHQLPEFDQGKRSCRRRLAGHNERRRKPPPASLLSTRYGNFSSIIVPENKRAGGFLMDFTTYPSLNGKSSWPNTRVSLPLLGNQSTVDSASQLDLGVGPAPVKYLHNQWQSNTAGNPPELFHMSATRMVYPGTAGVPLGECFGGVSDSSCALSLLSNQPHRPSSLEVNNLLNADGINLAQPSTTHGLGLNHISNSSWGFKGNDGRCSSDNMSPNLDLGQISHAADGRFSGLLESAQQNGRQFTELEHSEGYDSPFQHVHWSL